MKKSNGSKLYGTTSLVKKIYFYSLFFLYSFFFNNSPKHRLTIGEIPSTIVFVLCDNVHVYM